MVWRSEDGAGRGFYNWRLFGPCALEVAGQGRGTFYTKLHTPSCLKQRRHKNTEHVRAGRRSGLKNKSKTDKCIGCVRVCVGFACLCC